MTSEREIIESACECGEAVHVEVGGYSCRNDGKRPYHPGAADLTTQFRCRKCHKPLHETCVAAAFADASPPASHDAGDFIDKAAADIPADVMLTARAEQAEEELRCADQTIATLTAEVARLTGELDAASARLHEVATLCATVEQERDRLTAELEKEKAQSRHLAGAVSRKIDELIAAENQCAYYKAQYSRAEQVRKEACEANVKAQASVLWLEADLERSRKECEALRSWCKAAIRAYDFECYHAAAGYVQAGLDGEKFPETLADMSASGREGE